MSPDPTCCNDPHVLERLKRFQNAGNLPARADRGDQARPLTFLANVAAAVSAGFAGFLDAALGFFTLRPRRI